MSLLRLPSAGVSFYHNSTPFAVQQAVRGKNMVRILAFSAFTTSKTGTETFNIAPGRPKGSPRGVEEGPKQPTKPPRQPKRAPRRLQEG
eukprot:8705345-Pyramimonas_sp.AAC.1